MRNLDRPNGIWGTILLPIKNNEIDWVAFEEQVNILCDSNVYGVYTNGTAAECHNQTEDEFDKRMLHELNTIQLIKYNKVKE